ncbi:type-F conjugative transfer system pilin chaperone TraQ [Enterobacter huaxiensis]|uniref:type-F conjugative transfer system pilin chaperone TraQ n=1 Tax=Enterobacter huaxiensis TaxID=2494702 RepID=UPI0021DB6D25|nr:type-F conjugative transfer system pilin chaperone TraQ [Enterobacter huaxiensis]
MRRFRFRLPEFDAPGLWVLSLGIWFHIVSRLVRHNPAMAVMLAQIIGLSMALWGGYRIVNRWIEQVREAERRQEGGGHHED